MGEKKLVTVDTDTKVLEGVSDPVHSGSLTVEAIHPYIILSDTTTPAKKLRLRYDSYSGLFEIRNITDDIVAVTLATEISGITRIIGTNLSVYNETPQLELYDRTAGGKRVVMENNLSENSLILTNITDGIILDQIDLSTGARKIDLTVEKDTPKVNLKDTAAGGKEYRIYSQGGNLHVYNQTQGVEVAKFYPDKGIGFADTKEYRIYAEGDNLVIKDVTEDIVVIKYPLAIPHEMLLVGRTIATTSSDYVSITPKRHWYYYSARDFMSVVLWGVLYSSAGTGAIRLYNETDGVTIHEISITEPTDPNQEQVEVNITSTMKSYTDVKTLRIDIKGDGTNETRIHQSWIEVILSFPP